MLLLLLVLLHVAFAATVGLRLCTCHADSCIHGPALQMLMLLLLHGAASRPRCQAACKLWLLHGARHGPRALPSQLKAAPAPLQLHAWRLLLQLLLLAAACIRPRAAAGSRLQQLLPARQRGSSNGSSSCCSNRGTIHAAAC